ncbi:endo-1,4-beta-xylanase [candidate division KSB1 bacterium]|nr:endo-1,4-beta-xylanase [candidate division KSB1 bacterium]
MAKQELLFKPVFVQKGRGPHLAQMVYLTDEKGDTFRADIRIDNSGIKIVNTYDHHKFVLYVRWNVEGYGYLYMPADNGGEFHDLSGSGTGVCNLNFELAKTRIVRNQQRLKLFAETGYKPSVEVKTMLDLALTLLNDADRKVSDLLLCGELSQKSLMYALIASDMMEMEKLRFDLKNQSPRSDFFAGCDSRGYLQMDKDIFWERFTELFGYATITHYLKGDVINFEPEEGKKQFAERDKLVDELLKRNIVVEGRPLFWSHSWVTPDWLRQKSFDDVLIYLEKHIRTVLGHYGDRIRVWEVVNELHDWANELQLNHEQTIKLTRLACETAREVNPKIRLLINNCCPFAEYVQGGKWTQIPAKYPQRTPHQFITQLIEANVDFDIVGVQMYFVKRPPADSILLMERYADFGKKVQITEVGSPSAGITLEFDAPDENFSIYPCEWRRHWDEDLQADWLEYIFSFAYSKPWIEAANWYDLVDPYSYLKSGGILRSPKGEKKTAFDRLGFLLQQWQKK